MEINKDLMKELEAAEPDELVALLGITTDQIIRAFPGHAYDYIRDNFTLETDDTEEEALSELERLRDEGYTVLDGPPESPEE